MYVFHTDPSHGWLAVKLSELVRLGIDGKISSFSYENKGTVYLEEDCDMQKFVDAKEARNEDFLSPHTKHVDYCHPIRSYKPYKGE